MSKSVFEWCAGLVGNGYCNDEANIATCNYDGGDCCGVCGIKDHCVECLCHVEAEAYPSVSCKYLLRQFNKFHKISSHLKHF